MNKIIPVRIAFIGVVEIVGPPLIGPTHNMSDKICFVAICADIVIAM